MNTIHKTNKNSAVHCTGRKQGFEKFSGWMSRRNLQWVIQGMSRSMKVSLSRYISPAGLD